MDDFTSIWNRLRLRVSTLDPFLAQDMVRDAFNQLAERREWSWTQVHSALYPSNFSTTGLTCTVNPGSYLVTLGSNFFTPAIIGQQFRIGAPTGSNYPTYTLLQYLSPTQMLLDAPWVGPQIVSQQFSVFQCYFTMPPDFQSWISLVNVTNNYRLWTNVTQTELDIVDPQRVTQGISFCASYYDSTQNYQGQIGPVSQVIGNGTGAVPVTTTTNGYTFPQDSYFALEIITGGTPGTATYAYYQNYGIYVPNPFSNILTIPANFAPQNLGSGVALVFPSGTYNSGDTFIVQCKAGVSSAQLRYEIWPRPVAAQYVYPYLYRKIPPDLTDEHPQLPALIQQRGDVLLEMCLARSAAFPGTDTVRNPYYDLNLARMHSINAESLIYELEKKDDDTAMKNLTYANLPWATAPWLDGSYQQSHAWGPGIGSF